MFYKFLIKCPILRVQINLQVVLLKVNLYQTNSSLKNYTNQLLENFKTESAIIFYRQYLRC